MRLPRPGASECLEMPLVFPLARIFANPNHSLAVLRKSVTRFIDNYIAKSLAVLTGGELKASEASMT